jgi:hypothetical protein
MTPVFTFVSMKTSCFLLYTYIPINQCSGVDYEWSSVLIDLLVKRLPSSETAVIIGRVCTKRNSLRSPRNERKFWETMETERCHTVLFFEGHKQFSAFYSAHITSKKLFLDSVKYIFVSSFPRQWNYAGLGIIVLAAYVESLSGNMSRISWS